MANISDIIKEIESSIGPFTNKMVEEFKSNLIKVFREDAAKEIVAEFLKVYDELALEEESQAGARIKNKDPSSLKNLRPLFEAQISREVRNNIAIEGDELVIRLMNKSDLGFDGTGEGRPQTADVLAFYLEGVAGEFAFITPEHLKARRPSSNANLGRFGAGFLITRKEYERDKWDAITGIPFQDVRHPISGQPPFKGFKRAVGKISYSSYINIALERTVNSLRNTKV